MEDQVRRDRKYKAWWAAFLLSSVMAFWSKLSGGEWVEFNIYAFGLYMMGNVGEHFVVNGIKGSEKKNVGNSV